MNTPDYFLSSNLQTRWASPENPDALPGQGGRAKGGRKGRPSITLPAGESVTLAREEMGVSGTIRRLWLTIDDRSPQMLRGLRLDCFWDGADTAAVSVPLGDFFGVGMGRTTSFECAYFANPENRSFNCVLPMPFRSGMRITLTNESAVDLAYLFYDVNYTIGDDHGAETGYLHAHFRRENPTKIGRDYALLPPVSGRGRFIGVNIGVRANRQRYGRTWWGEGEAKFYIDGDSEHPTLCGTGTEDYIGTAWGQGQFAHRYQGCPVADDEAGVYCFYRYHVPDPVYFAQSLRVTIQQIGHAAPDRLRAVIERCGPLVAANPERSPLDLTTVEPSGALFERSDDWSSCAYFYLDRSENGLPPCPSVNERTADL